MSGKGPIPPMPPIVAPADVLATARANCAARLRSRGQHTEAEAFERAERDAAWSMRHEVAKLQREGQ